MPKTKSFPYAQLRRCAHRAGVQSTTHPFVAMMDEMLDKEAEKIIKKALVYKGSRRMTIGVNDIKFAYEGGEVFGAREEKDVV